MPCHLSEHIYVAAMLCGDMPGLHSWLTNTGFRLQTPPGSKGLVVDSRKLAPRCNGPYEIEKLINPTAVRLKLPASLHVHPTFHVSLLKPVTTSALSPPAEPSPSRCSLTITRPTRLTRFWMFHIEDENSSTSLTGWATAQRRGAGFLVLSSWTSSWGGGVLFVRISLPMCRLSPLPCDSLIPVFYL